MCQFVCFPLTRVYASTWKRTSYVWARLIKSLVDPILLSFHTMPRRELKLLIYPFVLIEKQNRQSHV